MSSLSPPFSFPLFPTLHIYFYCPSQSASPWNTASRPAITMLPWRGLKQSPRQLCSAVKTANSKSYWKVISCSKSWVYRTWELYEIDVNFTVIICLTDSSMPHCFKPWTTEISCSWIWNPSDPLQSPNELCCAICNNSVQFVPVKLMFSEDISSSFVPNLNLVLLVDHMKFSVVCLIPSRPMCVQTTVWREKCLVHIDIVWYYKQSC